MELNKKQARIFFIGLTIVMILLAIMLSKCGGKSSSTSTRGKSGYCYYCDKPAYAKFAGKDMCKQHYNEWMKGYSDWMSDQDGY